MRNYRNIPRLPNQWWKNPLYIITFGFGSGAAPIAPGTVGTLVALPLYWILSHLSLGMYLITVIMITLISMYLCDVASKKIGINDHQGMCLDEFVGLFVAMTGLSPTFLHMFFGFLLFRFFDIAKPWPISWIDQKIHGGVGMILDDVVAGIFTCALIHGSQFILI